jgi:hypothetical protein
VQGGIAIAGGLAYFVQLEALENLVVSIMFNSRTKQITNLHARDHKCQKT